jgi:hypothetical protein
MWPIKTIVIRDWYIHQVWHGGRIIAEFWIKQSAPLDLKDVIQEHGRASDMADRYDQVSEAGD